MRQGSTPVCSITVDADLREASAIRILLKDAKGQLIVIQKSRITVGATTLSFILTQAETLQLAEGRIRVQLRALLADGVTSIVSGIDETTMEELMEEVEICAED